MARGGFSRSQRMTKEWAATGIGAVEITSVSTVLLASLSFAAPATILRCLGEILVVFDETGVTAGEAAMLTFGLGVVSTDAATAGSASMPDPGAEPQYPWLWWYNTTIEAISASASTAAEIGSAYSRIPLESSAARRIKNNQSLALVVEYEGIQGTPPVDVTSGRVRVLLAT